MEAARRGAGLILVAAAFAGCGGSRGDRKACHADVQRGVIPEWARAGFSDPEPKMPHVLGRSGEIAGLIFGDPLTSPPRPKVANKILWVARETPSAPGELTIRARSGSRTVTRKVDVGPSIVNLPAAGCWRLTLSWAGHTDTLDLQYERR